MHLNREQAGELGRALLGFAETGKLGESGEAAPQNLQLERELKDAQTKIEELRAILKRGRQALDEAVSERNQAFELSIGYEVQRNESNRRADQAEAALADRIEHCEKYHSSNSAIVKTLTNQHGQAFAVYLSDGQKINIQRAGGAAWLRIEPTPIVREAGEGGPQK
jgi:hypothetical protein